ncbi:uncharacterized protein LOC116193189 [Punica granatum]|uniref:Uncharacterized protein n=2 Tax=Punica granatum TaxID=22663 RepID=A0A218VVM9_PUNGR|nr:uncharacterized protein LOC116193189 [Punica granatum]OWM64150.1 hypothetical protein CDL15_Pgr018721 [Punica granatum]PKI45723.1 hypothetical protein CRG98_033856 [Punica granatum]
MAMYVDEEEVWKCPKHTSKRRRSGICPTCLKERLNSLCPDCANLRPCGCCASTTTSSSSSSSSSFSRFFSGGGDNGSAGSVGRVSNLIESEPSFRRSRSVAVSLFRSRSRYANDLGAGHQGNGERGSPGSRGSRTASFWGMFRRDKSRRSGGGFEETVSCNGEEIRRTEDKGGADVAAASKAAEDQSRMMRKSRSVAVTSNYGGGDLRSAGGGKGRGWYFPSPIKAFRQSKVSKAAVAQERSPLYRG